MVTASSALVVAALGLAPAPGGDPEPAPTVVCVVNAGVPGDGAPDALPRLDCSVLSCVVVDGMPGTDGTPDAARLVLCQGDEQ